MIRSERNTQTVADHLKSQLLILGTVLATMWALELLDVIFFGQALNAYGIWPRRLIGLWGILFMPFLHGGLAHLAANTLPFLVLGWLVMLPRLRDFWAVTIITMLAGGALLWLLGASRAVYIGASGLIFGYFGFLLMRGFFERSIRAIVIAVLVAAVYGGLIWGIVPQRPGVSWEAHLFGLLAGAFAAYLLSPPRSRLRPSDP